MPKVITEGSTIVCPHQAPITFTASQHSLKVGDNYVLVAADVLTGTVKGCPNLPMPATPNNKPCTKVVSLLAGAATIFTVGEQPVLLETATGLTDALPPLNVWKVQSAGQTKLDVV
jgi:hypothetical protein